MKRANQQIGFVVSYSHFPRKGNFMDLRLDDQADQVEEQPDPTEEQPKLLEEHAPLFQNRKFLMGLVAACMAMVLISGGMFWALGRTPAGPPPSPTPAFEALPDLRLTPAASLDELAKRYPQIGDLLRDPSLNSVYKDFLVAYQTGGIQSARGLAVQRGLLNKKDQVRITLVIDSPDNTQRVADELEKFGLTVEGTYQDMIDLAVPMLFVEQFARTENPGKLFEQLTQLKHVVKLRLPVPSRNDARLPKVEGVDTTNATQWHTAGFTGKGVKVGVLDLGFDGYRNLLGKELPANVTVKSFAYDQEADASGSVHGTACAEVIHAMAPDAELYFAYYDGRQVGQGRAVDWLLEQGVNIISHSATGLAAPMDGTGKQAQMVEQVVGKGIVWVNAMGNYAAGDHYRGTFTDTDGNNRHEFPNGKEVMTYRPPKDGVTILLSWDDWKKKDQDYDLFLYDNKSNLIASSQDAQSGAPGDDPFEYIRLTEPDKTVYYIAIEARQATRAVNLNLFAPDGELEFPSPAYSLGTPADAPSSLSIGAIEWDSSQLEDFSSQGPTIDERLKPDLAAPDKVTTASYAPRPFYGTSAAAPHVAGAAALILSAFPNYTPQQVRDYLIANAQDLGPAGPDSAFGYGSLHLPAPQAAQPPAPIVVPPTPVKVVPAPITPIPRGRPVATGNASLGILMCLGGVMCLGMLGMLGGAVLLIASARPAPRKPVYGPASPMPPVPIEACLLTNDGECILLRTGDTTIGRSHENDLVLAEDNQISRHHATIAWDGQHCTVTDLGSSNGTFVNGARIPARVPHPLRSGDRVRFGPDAKFVVRLPQA
jgi:subtilisin family serine protease